MATQTTSTPATEKQLTYRNDLLEQFIVRHTPKLTDAQLAVLKHVQQVAIAIRLPEPTTAREASDQIDGLKATYLDRGPYNTTNSRAVWIEDLLTEIAMIENPDPFQMPAGMDEGNGDWSRAWTIPWTPETFRAYVEGLLAATA